MSQEALAFEIESSPRHVSRLETGRVSPSDQMVEQIAESLGLGSRDTAHLMAAAGHTPRAAAFDPSSKPHRWLRRTAAIMLRSLDPAPSMLTDGVAEIHLVNRSWLELFGARIDPASPDALRDYFAFLLDAIGDEGPLSLESRCGLLLTLRQEALIRDDPRLHQLVDELASDAGVPDRWAVVAAGIDPVATFGITVEIDGAAHRCFHMSQAIHPQGPSTYLAGAGLAMLSLLPDDPSSGWPALLERDHDHERSAERLLARES